MVAENIITARMRPVIGAFLRGTFREILNDISFKLPNDVHLEFIENKRFLESEFLIKIYSKQENKSYVMKAANYIKEFIKLNSE